MKNHALLALLLALSASLSCKNFLGNPHATPVAPRLVPATNITTRIEPPNWWIGLKHRQVEILINRKDVATFDLNMDHYKSVKIKAIEKTDNPNYLFVTLDISPKAKPGKAVFRFQKGAESFSLEYPLLARDTVNPERGLTSKDVLYLLMPDRFANGDPSNDNVAGMLDGLHRDSLRRRHGGDLQGILDHLDYLKDLGVSALWLNPELENDQQESFHGYAVTDHYRVDRRLGTNELLKRLIAECHRRGLKFVRDIVLNHIGDNHYWMHDMPAKDWLNVWPEFTQTTYRAPVLVDPYSSDFDKKKFSDGWFVKSMPDLNQRNPHVANYLIQQSIWWVEFAGVDDYRIDTYTYSDQAFCSRWCRELLDEYPHMNMFGEIWENTVPTQAFFADNQPMRRANFDSNLPGVVDFQLMFALHEALNKEQTWEGGINRVWYTLAQDYFYEHPERNVVMLDNHDFTRIYTTLGENFDKFKSAYAFLLTTRGIPQLYYLDEILATGGTWPNDGLVRQDFPGGWRGDAANKFTASGRSARENEAFNYVRTLLHFRNETPALQSGKLMQFVPEDGVYTYFRWDEAKTVMVVLNTANSDKTLETKRFAERMAGFSKARNVATGEVLGDFSKLNLPKNSSLVLELLK